MGFQVILKVYLNEICKSRFAVGLVDPCFVSLAVTGYWYLDKNNVDSFFMKRMKFGWTVSTCPVVRPFKFTLVERKMKTFCWSCRCVSHVQQGRTVQTSPSTPCRARPVPTHWGQQQCALPALQGTSVQSLRVHQLNAAQEHTAIILQLCARNAIRALFAKIAAGLHGLFLGVVQWDTTAQMEEQKKCAHQERLETLPGQPMKLVAVTHALLDTSVQRPQLVTQVIGGCPTHRWLYIHLAIIHLVGGSWLVLTYLVVYSFINVFLSD